MPLLNPNNLPFSPISRALMVLRDNWRNATGIIGKLNPGGVELGVDKILQDAIEQRPLESAMPCIRLVAQTDSYTLASNAGVSVRMRVPVSAFFLYNFGAPQSSIIPSAFADLRERHIRWNLYWLKDQRVLPFDAVGITPAGHLDDAGRIFWYWPDGTQEIQVTHDTPFSVLGINVPFTPSNGFACSRVDFVIEVMNNATFTGDYIPYRPFMLTPFRIDTEITRALALTDVSVKFTNASRTGISAPTSGLYAGFYYMLTNATGVDFTTGDFLIPGDKQTTWLVQYDGSAWTISIQGYS